VTFVLGRLLASGARLFIAGSALGYLLAPGSDDTMGIQIVAIIVLVIAAIAYVWIGGIRSVIWTDVLQAGVFVGGALIVIAILLNRIPLEFGEILSHLSAPGPEEPSKLTVVSDGFTDFSPSNSYSLLAILLGVSLINLGAYGTDQDLAQRLLTCKDSRQGSRSAIMAVLMAIPVSFLFIAIGMLLWFFYERPDLMADMAPGYERPENARVLAVFIVNELSGGLAGLLAAGLAAAAISSLTSEINAIAATVATDLYKPLKPQADDRQVLRVGRIGVPLAGAALAVVAIASIELSKSAGDVVDFALMVMMYAYAGLVAVFLCALCTPRGNQWSAVAALVVGFGWICLFQFTPLGSNLAFPYQMFFATLIAFIVCVCGNPRRPAH
jgi:Na+/proline symporter